MNSPVTAVRIHAVDGDQTRERPDRLVTEEPMEIRIQSPGREAEALAVTMRTPGADFDLAVGFCLTEGVIDGLADLASVAYCLSGQGPQEYNVVTVGVRHPVSVPTRNFVANASCGLCGKTTLEEVSVRCPPVAPGPVVASTTLTALPARLRECQATFAATGGLHAAARFDPSGRLIAIREDVGRHNALDKLIGNAALDGALPLRDDILFVSGRISFEIVQKAAVAGLPIVCAVSAPSSLAVEAADSFEQTLVGFLRNGRFNVYAGAGRIDMAS
ncbi:MAG: formate dehydrogenase accessory sulfurtransferase FdhD [Acidimicrobiia bacterium]